jgi:DNA-binding Xre family transcriptional regulator
MLSPQPEPRCGSSPISQPFADWMPSGLSRPEPRPRRMPPLNPAHWFRPSRRPKGVPAPWNPAASGAARETCALPLNPSRQVEKLALTRPPNRRWSVPAPEDLKPARCLARIKLLIVCRPKGFEDEGYSPTFWGMGNSVLRKLRSPSIEIVSILAENIRHLRKVKNISQEELADLCGIHRTYVGSVERCERNVTLSTLELLSTALEVSVVQLLTPMADDTKSEQS